MKCAECRYNGNCKEKSECPDLCGCTSGIPIEKMGIRTNADKIRAMTNAELAEFLVIGKPDFSVPYCTRNKYGDCNGCVDRCLYISEIRRAEIWLESRENNG